MHKKTKYLLTVVGLLASAAASYALLRAHATQVANRDIDGFFASFHSASEWNAENKRPEISEKAKEIISRHREALKNYTYSDLTPDLNFMLDETRVDVSWHLAIIFSKRSGHWQPTLYSEHDSK